MCVAAPRTPVGGWGPRPPQKFGHRPYFTGQLQFRKQFSQINLLNKNKGISFFPDSILRRPVYIF